MALKGLGPEDSGGAWEAAIAWRMWCPACGLESPAILGLLMPPQWQVLEEPVAILRSTCAKDHLTECLLNVSVLYEGGQVRVVGLGRVGCGFDKLTKEVGTELIGQLPGDPKEWFGLRHSSGSLMKVVRFWIVWALTWLKSWVSAVQPGKH